MDASALAFDPKPPIPAQSPPRSRSNPNVIAQFAAARLVTTLPDSSGAGGLKLSATAGLGTRPARPAAPARARSAEPRSGSNPRQVRMLVDGGDAQAYPQAYRQARPQSRPDQPPPPPSPPRGATVPPGVRESMAYWKERALQLDAELAAVKMREAELAAQNTLGMELNEKLIAKLQSAKGGIERMDEMANKLQAAEAAAEAERAASHLQRNQHRLKLHEYQHTIEAEIRRQHDERLNTLTDRVKELENGECKSVESEPSLHELEIASAPTIHHSHHRLPPLPRTTALVREQEARATAEQALRRFEDERGQFEVQVRQQFEASCKVLERRMRKALQARSAPSDADNSGIRGGGRAISSEASGGGGSTGPATPSSARPIAQARAQVAVAQAGLAVARALSPGQGNRSAARRQTARPSRVVPPPPTIRT